MLIDLETQAHVKKFSISMHFKVQVYLILTYEFLSHEDIFLKDDGYVRLQVCSILFVAP